MPIPAFDSNSVLPPHLGDPRQRSELSPYPCTSLDLCQRFGHTPERITILEGFLNLRAELSKHGVIEGFQWIDGSFLEDIENTEGRAPKDIDVVTFYWSQNPNFTDELFVNFPELANLALIKLTYKVDHFPVDTAFHPAVTVDLTRYWCGLFSHTRQGIWKGMLRIELNTLTEDAKAQTFLTKGGVTP